MRDFVDGEVWHDAEYLLTVRRRADGAFEVWDPQSKAVDSVFETYEEVVDDLCEDEFTGVFSTCVYVRTADPIDVVVSGVRQVTGLTFEKMEGQTPCYCASGPDGRWIWIGPAEPRSIVEQDDERMRFTFEVSIDGIVIDGHDDSGRTARGEALFDALRTEERWELLLWDERGGVLARHEPAR